MSTITAQACFLPSVAASAASHPYGGRPRRTRQQACAMPLNANQCLAMPESFDQYTPFNQVVNNNASEAQFPWPYAATAMVAAPHQMPLACASSSAALAAPALKGFAPPPINTGVAASGSFDFYTPSPTPASVSLACSPVRSPRHLHNHHASFVRCSPPSPPQSPPRSSGEFAMLMTDAAFARHPASVSSYVPQTVVSSSSMALYSPSTSASSTSSGASSSSRTALEACPSHRGYVARA